MLSRLTGRMVCRRCSTATRDSIIENMQTNAKAYGLILSLIVASATGVNVLVSSHINPISQEQKLLRQDMKELRQEMHQEMKGMRQEMHQEMKGMRQEMHHEMKEIRQEMSQNQKELLLAVSKSDEKYTMYGERLAKLEK
jgi:DNA anti-recombination protein RmuC